MELQTIPKDVLQIRLAGLDSEHFRKFVDLLMFSKNIKYEIVEKFTDRAGLVFGAGPLLSVEETLLGCVHIQIPDETQETICSVETIISATFRAEMKNLPGRATFFEIEKLTEDIYKKNIWPVFESKIDLAKKMVREQIDKPISKNLLDVIKHANEIGGFQEATILLDSVIYGLVGLDGNLVGIDLFRWNDGFVIDKDLDEQSAKKMRTINFHSGKSLPVN